MISVIAQTDDPSDEVDIYPDQQGNLDSTGTASTGFVYISMAYIADHENGTGSNNGLCTN